MSLIPFTLRLVDMWNNSLSNIKSSFIKYIYSLLECQRGTYGINCSGLCGHCSDLSECSHIDGSCLTGCDDGYHGRLCDKGNC